MYRGRIARENWNRCLDGVSRRHAHSRVSVAVFGPETAPYIEARRQYLQGISLDRRASRLGAVSIVLETPDGGHIEHVVRHPVQMLLGVDDVGDDQALTIESADGTTTLVEFAGELLN